MNAQTLDLIPQIPQLCLLWPSFLRSMVGKGGKSTTTKRPEGRFTKTNCLVPVSTHFEKIVLKMGWSSQNRGVKDVQTIFETTTFTGNCVCWLILNFVTVGLHSARATGKLSPRCFPVGDWWNYIPSYKEVSWDVPPTHQTTGKWRTIDTREQNCKILPHSWWEKWHAGWILFTKHRSTSGERSSRFPTQVSQGLKRVHGFLSRPVCLIERGITHKIVICAMATLKTSSPSP